MKSNATHRINEDILRYMSIRVDEFDANPSPVLKKREERKRRDDDRNKRG